MGRTKRKELLACRKRAAKPLCSLKGVTDMAGAYQALYRKWRPMIFEDVVGQDHVSETLKTSIAAERIAHAYLFCGTRGTGKTSTAKIFSRAVNCENPQDGEPCNECATCRGILDGSILDVYEMGAASNRGVENIREIRDEVIYTPAGCRYKVYIIDEVHMLTTEAFNALLKTLEEPPSHALFILATTEPNRIPPTVLSRCQRFDFRRIGIDDIAGRLNKIIQAENIGATPDAVELIAELGDGSMRDALSVLEQCAAFGIESLTTQKVAEIVGIADPNILFETAEAISKDDTGAALTLVKKHLNQGKEAQIFIDELTTHFRNLLICKAAENSAELLEKSEDAANKYKEQANLFSTERLLYSIKLLSESIAQAKWTANPEIITETTIVKLCTPSLGAEKEALLARIEKLESMLKNGAVSVGTETVQKAAAKVEKKEDVPPWKEEEPTPKKEAENQSSAVTLPQEKEVIWELWGDALEEIKKESKSLFAFLYSGKAYLNGDTVELELNSTVAYDRIAKPEGIAYLSKLFTRINGSEIKVKAFVEGERKKEAEEKKNSIFDLAKKKELLGDKINIIE